jgi:hypothetical protein
MRIGQQAADGRIEERLDLVGLDAPSRQDTGQQFGETMALRHRQGDRPSAGVQPVAPGASRGRLRHPKKEAVSII